MGKTSVDFNCRTSVTFIANNPAQAKPAIRASFPKYGYKQKICYFTTSVLPEKKNKPLIKYFLYQFTTYNKAIIFDQLIMVLWVYT